MLTIGACLTLIRINKTSLFKYSIQNKNTRALYLKTEVNFMYCLRSKSKVRRFAYFYSLSTLGIQFNLYINVYVPILVF